MPSIHEYLFPAMWVTYLVYWWAKSADVKSTERREPAESRITRMLLMVSAMALLAIPRIPIEILDRRFLPASGSFLWIGAVVTAGGFLFSAWGRRHLGKNWSQAVTLKEGHELITNGPYALVRHPIYAGLLLAFVGWALARGEWRGVIAVALVFIALWRKLTLEEKWMREHFGESYGAYSRRVAALVPHII